MPRNPSTTHHVAPTSMGGSDSDINLINSLHYRRHDNFHQWATNMFPTQCMRMRGIDAIGREESIHPDILEAIFQITTVLRTDDLFHSEAFVNALHPTVIERSRKAKDFELTHWIDEVASVRHALHALRNGAELPVEHRPDDHVNFLRFFKTRNSVQALNAMTTEKKGRKFTWFNSVQPVTRQELEKCTRSHTLIPTEEHRNRLIEILEKQEDTLNRFQEARRKEIAATRDR